jgi:hypothetical protein
VDFWFTPALLRTSYPVKWMAFCGPAWFYPQPGLPIIMHLCPPAAATSKALFNMVCPGHRQNPYRPSLFFLWYGIPVTFQRVLSGPDGCIPHSSLRLPTGYDFIPFN